MPRCRAILAIIFALLAVALARAEEADGTAATAAAVDPMARPGTVDIFLGLDFNYRDIYLHGRPGDILLNLTPGVRWYLPHRWEIAGRALVPIVNQFGKGYGRVRLDMASISRQMAFRNRLALKLSAGLFSLNRYGFDARARYALSPVVALDGQIGFTGFCSMADGWSASKLGRLTFLAGPDFWIAPWASEIRLRGGRFVYGDYGALLEAMRHFRHVTVAAFGSWSSADEWNAGFKITIMLPPYRRSARRVNFRPASAFKFTYRNDANPYLNRQYNTDPEENDRSGWFYPSLLPWGPQTMPPDFTRKPDARKEGAQP